jgi:phenylalanyl-tRNA synthetase alpha chain
MEAELNQVQAEATASIATAEDLAALEQVRQAVLGKRGLLATRLPDMKNVPPEQRPMIGRQRNEIQQAVQAAFDARRAELEAAAEEAARKAEELDVTLPGRAPRRGRKHPLTLVLDEIVDIFVGLGFTVAEGPEVELEYYNFIALNIPPDHPARDDHDSFYVTDHLLLRTETSAVQIRTMEMQEPPVRIIAPGRVYRRDAVDATHTHTFHQVEGLWVDEHVTFGDLKGTLHAFARQMFGADVRMRFRPDHFPFTEPSAEASISCFACGGSGCGLCKQTGWIEILGCGMVHPQVLENCGYDSEQLTGYAFGMGLERLAMLKYGIPDIRLFFENDLRFLRQF